MPLKDRFRKAMGRDDKSDRGSFSSGSTSSKNTSGTTTPTSETFNPLTMTQTALDTTTPKLTITKTHSLLSKTLTWSSSSSVSGEKKSKQEIAREKKLKQWAKSDHVEWASPTGRRGGKKDLQCQNMLRAWDLGTAENGLGMRNHSVCSGISPNASRVNSIGMFFRFSYFRVVQLLMAVRSMQMMVFHRMQSRPA